MHVDRRLLGWGLFFVLLGTIPLAVRAGLLDKALISQWPLLWPVLLIGWGLGLLLRGTPLALVGGAVGAITLGIMGGGAIATGFGNVSFASGCSSTAPSTPFAARSGDLGATARVDLIVNCGNLTVNTGAGTTWSVAGSARDAAGPVIEASAGSLSARTDSDRNFLGTHGRSVWNVTLPRSTSMALGLTLNAGEGNLDLAGATISTVSMTLNAGSINLGLAGTTSTGDINATVNAGSAAVALPSGQHAVNLSLNAGSLTVCVPAGTQVRAQWSGALGSNNFDAAGLAKVDNQTWTSSGFVAGQPHVELHVSANAGSVELQFGGTCRA
ncbi:MAG TPA: hypothetical protein VM347_22170 [Nonomuraea sp.]|nr:hypothetical protein [Nonomuraea sp.]